MLARPQTAAAKTRRGFLAPALALAILTVLLIGGVMLNALWLRSAKRELAAAADAAALAAAGELACDEQLLPGPLPQAVFTRAAARAQTLAARQPVAGKPAAVVGDAGAQFGKTVGTQFLQSEYTPRQAVVTVARGSDGRLPWLMAIAGNATARPTVTATAALSSQITELRPRAGGTVPVWPIALRGNAASVKTASSGAIPAAAAAIASWNTKIDAGLGGDAYAFDAATGRVENRADGIKEIIVFSQARGGNVDEVGLVVCDLGQSFGIADLGRTFQHGLAADDLGTLHGAVPVSSLATAPVLVDALGSLPPEFDQNVTPGDVRALFLFAELVPAGGKNSALLNRVVVARLMDLQPAAGGAWQATFQPAVLATGTAVVDESASEHPYLYRLRLMR